MRTTALSVFFVAACTHAKVSSGTTSGGTTGGGSSSGTSSGSSSGTTGGSTGGTTAGATSSGGGAFPLGGITLPWQVFDASVPDTPFSTAPGKTWYADPVGGDDSWDGTSFTHGAGSQGPKKTVAGVLALSIHAGDTILLGGGIYREYPNIYSLGGAAGAPVTIGSYGRGTGAPIIDGGLASATWTRYTDHGQTTVWKSATSGLSKIDATHAVLGVYVNSGHGEAALREVFHTAFPAADGQLYDTDGLPPLQTQADITDNSNEWFFDPAGTLYADFGGTLGTADPNQADISMLYKSHSTSAEPLIVLGSDYLNFVGLTLRAGSWTGTYSNGASHISLDRCDVKFNGGGGIAFSGGSDNTVTNTRIWMNVLDNWPRFNNGNSGGGWPGGLSWFAESRALAQGNLVRRSTPSTDCMRHRTSTTPILGGAPADQPELGRRARIGRQTGPLGQYQSFQQHLRRRQARVSRLRRRDLGSGSWAQGFLSSPTTPLSSPRPRSRVKRAMARNTPSPMTPARTVSSRTT